MIQLLWLHVITIHMRHHCNHCIPGGSKKQSLQVTLVFTIIHSAEFTKNVSSSFFSSFLSACLPPCIPIYLYTWQPVYLTTCIPDNLSTCPPDNLSTWQPDHLTTCLPDNLSTHLNLLWVFLRRHSNDGLFLAGTHCFSSTATKMLM